MGRIIVLLEGELLPASIIDHTGPRPPEPAPGVTVEYGEYMSFACSVCHGEELSGGTVPGDEPDAPPAPNLTPRGTLGQWSEEDFIGTLRSGTTPYGKRLDDEFMPWKDFGLLTDDQLKAIADAGSAPPVEDGDAEIEIDSGERFLFPYVVIAGGVK